MTPRSTVVVPDRLAHHRVTMKAALNSEHGVRVTTLAGLAARLAGPLLTVVDEVTVRRAVAPVPVAQLETLAAVAELPGFPRAVATTLQGAWLADIHISAKSERLGGRWNDIAVLERAVVGRLPAHACTPRDIVRRACQRVHLAGRITGDVALDGLGEISPVYRPLLEELAKQVRVRWLGRSEEPPSPVPAGVEYRVPPETAPRIRLDVCADPHHEVVEAFRWARRLLSTGTVKPGEIAIAAASPEQYEDGLIALEEESNLPVHFAHGVPALTTRDGQAAAALADVLIRGIDRQRVSRLVSLTRNPGSGSPELAKLPAGWGAVLPKDAPLTTIGRWERSLAAQGDGLDEVREVLRELGRDLARGIEAASEIGERWLRGRPRLLWRRALDEGPASAVDVSLTRLTVDDGLDPSAAIVWASASAVAASPRKHVRLLGLNTRSWPRRSRQDPLLPQHVLDGLTLHEHSVAERDRLDFRSISKRAETEVVLSSSKRDAEGRRLAPSPLLNRLEVERKRELQSRRLPEHAFSEADRRLARPSEVQRDPFARAALATWRGWYRDELNEHDGLTRPNHPAVDRALGRVHSATSLRWLLLNPLGFLWKYALGWREPSDLTEELMLNRRDRGELIHAVLERTVVDLERGPGLSSAATEQIDDAARRAVEEVAEAWVLERPVPPEFVWQAVLEEAHSMTVTALSLPLETLEGQNSFVEVLFGDVEARDEQDSESPWDPRREVRLGGELRISGRIDRLDLSGDGRRARVVDYKSSPSDRKLEVRAVDVDEGRELQRCLYAYAVRDLLGGDLDVEAALVYPFSERVEMMRDPKGTLDGLVRVVDAARIRLREGYAVHGPDAESGWFEFRLALPADLERGYLERKAPALEAARRPIDEILLAAPQAEPAEEQQ